MALLKRTTLDGKMLLHRSADQWNILQEIYRQHGASKLQDVDPRYAMSTIYPWWRRKAFRLAAHPYFSPASVCPVFVERSWLNAATICVTTQN